MTSRSSSPRDVVLPRWIRPFHRCWKPLAWIWGGLLFGVFVNVSSSWLTNKNFDMSGTPLGWGVKHLWITLPPLLLLVLLTLLAGLASLQEHAISPAPPLTLTPKQRLQFIRGFQQEYTSRLTSSLQEQMALELHLQERTDVIASSARLVFHHFETGQASPLPLGTSIIQAYDRASRGLLLLGAPGSGKTTLLLELARELLQRAENDPDQPVAIILNLSSWAGTQLPLAQWLGEQCSLVHGIPKHLTAAWISQEQVQFLLDGLDEVGTSARTDCIEAINTYRRAHLVPLVVCSRSQEYETQPAHLILPGAVEIQPLEPAQVSKVLEQAGKSLASVQAALRSNAILSDLLTTPLMLSIAILTYRDRMLKELPQSGSPQEQQRQIFEQYVQHMLKRYQQRRNFSHAQTTSSLVWLAQQMQQRHLTEFHLESLQADWLSTRRARIAYRLVVGLSFGLVVGLLFRLVSGLLFGLVVGLLFGLVVGLVVVLVGVLFFRLVSVLFVVLVGALLVGLVGGLLVGLGGTPLAKNVRLKPNQGIHTSGWNALRLGLVLFPVFGLLGGLLFGLVFGLLGGLLFGLLSGLFGGLVSGLVFGGKAYVQHYVLRWFLAHGRALPWKVVPFLEEVTGCVLLQRVGGGYRFVHPLLQEYFASLPFSLTT